MGLSDLEQLKITNDGDENGPKNVDEPSKETTKPPSALVEALTGPYFKTGEANLHPEPSSLAELDNFQIVNVGDTVGRSIIFDKFHLNTKETELIQEFLTTWDETLGTTQDKAGAIRKHPNFKWYFDELDDSFFEEFVRQVRTRQNSLQMAGLATDFDESVRIFRDKAQRRLLKEALGRHFDMLPVAKFEIREPNGTLRDADYNPQNPQDKSNDIDYLYINGKDGSQELVITHNKAGCKLRPQLFTDPLKNGKFGMTSGSFEKIGSGKDEYFQFELQSDAKGNEPMFSRVRVYINPVDLDNEIDTYLEQETQKNELRKREDEEVEKRRRQQTYAPPAPSVPSNQKPRSSGTTTYVSPRSG